MLMLEMPDWRRVSMTVQKAPKGDRFRRHEGRTTSFWCLALFFDFVGELMNIDGIGCRGRLSWVLVHGDDRGAAA